MILLNAALLLGMFGMPLLLLQLGHRLRDRTPIQRRIFWGGVIGHSLGAIVTCLALMLPPVLWGQDGPDGRVLAVYGGMLIGALIGMAIGAVSVRRAPHPQHSAD